MKKDTPFKTTILDRLYFASIFGMLGGLVGFDTAIGVLLFKVSVCIFIPIQIGDWIMKLKRP